VKGMAVVYIIYEAYTWVRLYRPQI